MMLGTIKERLVAFAVMIILTMCAVALVGKFYSMRFETAYRKMENSNRMVLWIQKARIAEKAYRKYYEESYGEVVFANLAPLEAMLNETLPRLSGNGAKLPALTRAYRESFAKVIVLHRRNVDLGRRLDRAMTSVKEQAKVMMHRIHYRDFHHRTSRGVRLAQMESGLLSPIQDVNSMALLVQLNHQRFLLTGEAGYLDTLYDHMDWHGPGLFGALEQGTRFTGNAFYRATVRYVRQVFDDSLFILRESSILLSEEENAASRLDILGEELAGIAGEILHQASRESLSAKSTFTKIIGIIILLGTLFIVLFVSTLTAAITRPLSHMVAVARAIRGGKLDLTIETERRDEFGHLATVFNDMTRHLGDSLTRLKREVAEREAAEKSLKRMSRQLITTLEAERAAIARELHDELGQVLTALKIEVVWLRKNIGPGPTEVHRRIRNMCATIDWTFDDVRNLALRLRPRVLDDLGLVAAVRWLTEDFERRTGIRTRFHSRDFRIGDDTVSTNVYRVLQEALTNVMRHSGAGCVNIDLSVSGGNLRAVVSDDGNGFDTGMACGTGALGLTGMRERVHLIDGELNIISGPGKGCTVILEVPAEIWKGEENDQSTAGR